MDIADFFGRYGKYYKDKTAVVSSGKTISFEEMVDRVYRLANGLLAMGVRPNTAVALLADNCPEFLEVFFARYILGTVEVSLNTKLTPDEWARQINETNSRLVIASETLLSKLLSLRSQLSGVNSFVSISGSLPGTLDYESLIGSSSAKAPEIDVDVSQQRLGRIVYTGGTTGLPKGVMLSRGADLAQLRNMLTDLAADISGDDIFLGLQPMYHAVRPFFFPCWMRGATHVIVPDFHPEASLAAIQMNRVTIVKTVPTVLIRLIASPDIGKYNLRSLRTIYYGGSPIPVEKLREAIGMFGPIFVQNYGQTESAMTVCYLSKRDHELVEDPHKSTILTSVGRPYSWVEVKLIAEDGREVGPGGMGELVVRGDHNMMGYLNRPEETIQTLKDGWVHTRDIGKVDEEGYIYLLDRKGDVIVTGGENVFPGEVEQLLYQHPAIIEACVFGIPDDHWGESVTAAICLKRGMKTTEAELIEFCKSRLARYKCPKKILFYDSLPKSGTGKILRRGLRAPWWEGRERAIH